MLETINLDTNLSIQRMVNPGETVHRKEYYTAIRGKEANQAVHVATFLPDGSVTKVIRFSNSSG